MFVQVSPEATQNSFEKKNQESGSDSQNIGSNLLIEDKEPEDSKESGSRKNVSNVILPSNPLDHIFQERQTQTDQICESPFSENFNTPRRKDSPIHDTDFCKTCVIQSSDNVTKYLCQNGYETIIMSVAVKPADDAIDWKNMSDDEKKIYSSKVRSHHVHYLVNNGGRIEIVEGNAGKSMDFSSDYHQMVSDICDLSRNTPENNLVNTEKSSDYEIDTEVCKVHQHHKVNVNSFSGNLAITQDKSASAEQLHHSLTNVVPTKVGINDHRLISTLINDKVGNIFDETRSDDREMTSGSAIDVTREILKNGSCATLDANISEFGKLRSNLVGRSLSGDIAPDLLSNVEVMNNPNNITKIACTSIPSPLKHGKDDGFVNVCAFFE